MKVIGLSITLVILFCAAGMSQQKQIMQSISAKQLTGTWQYKSKNIGAGLLENFKFSGDGKFTYTFDPSNNNKILNIKGSYSVNKDKLRLVVESYIENVGGELGSAGVGSSVDLFEFSNDKQKLVTLKNPNVLDALFLSDYDEHTKSITINNKKFFKVSSKILVN